MCGYTDLLRSVFIPLKVEIVNAEPISETTAASSLKETSAAEADAQVQSSDKT